MMRLLSKKLTYMEVGYMLDKLWIKLLVKWEYWKFYMRNPMKWWVMYRIKYFNWLNRSNDNG